jgi:hypothetical protein
MAMAFPFARRLAGAAFPFEPRFVAAAFPSGRRFVAAAFPFGVATFPAEPRFRIVAGLLGVLAMRSSKSVVAVGASLQAGGVRIALEPPSATTQRWLRCKSG